MLHEILLLLNKVWKMVEGIVGGTVDKNKGPAIGVEQEFVVERIGETKAMVVMAQLVILGDTRVFYQFLLQQPRLQLRLNPPQKLQNNQIRPQKVLFADLMMNARQKQKWELVGILSLQTNQQLHV